ncbi:hypothetical protein AB0L85_13345 [Streptomyces sp. NPDC052051]|uniref:hypothetical protein n=1 Tax=Streptomyces sp. NPDC052051 TaxID=3154649 RepID=UPI00342AB261
MTEIAKQVAALHGPGSSAPFLALGVFERVGSNWLSDSLRRRMPQHNEPFRQQLSRQHPLVQGERTLFDLTGAALDPLGAYHLSCALSDLYGSPRNLVKETNLFFGTETVLRLLPASPAIILTRAPLGIASSFEHGHLWGRWKYEQRYLQVAATAKSPNWRDFEPLAPQDSPSPSVAIGRLMALNTLLLANSLHQSGRQTTVVSYEEHVRNPAAVRDELGRFLGIPVPPVEETAPSGRSVADPTFVTTKAEEGLVTRIEPGAADLISATVSDSLEKASSFLPDEVTRTAREWLAGDGLYEVRKPASSNRTARPPKLPPRLPEPSYVPLAGGTSWRNLLVTNREMAELLTLLHRAGLPNTVQGTNLMVCPMPHERGGRLHFDPGMRRWRVSRGYEAHPAYWVTWLGAAIMASWAGARLPSRQEALDIMSLERVTNCHYLMGDACPVIEPGRLAGEVHHPVGNVQVWCQDGPPLTDRHPAQRYLAGAAWNTPGSDRAVRQVRSRYLLGSSRGVGIRLTRDGAVSGSSALGAWELATRINKWISQLGGPAVPLGESDRRLLETLEIS